MMRAIVFSKDRPLQIDACLRSLALHSESPIETWVIWTASTEAMGAAYDTLRAIHASVRFDREGVFQSDVWAALSDDSPEHILFVTDDTIFVRAWDPVACMAALDSPMHDDAIGVSLRLGSNTTQCYPLAREQREPPRSMHPCRLWEHYWPGADGDWGYPLELSSSVYRARDVLHMLDGVSFCGPNELEAKLAYRAIPTWRPYLLTYETSVAFSNPCNRVQNVFANRSGDAPAQSASMLLHLWQQGLRMRVESYAGFTPDGAHMIAPIYLEQRP